MTDIKTLIPELNENQWKLLKEWIELEIIGLNYELPKLPHNAGLGYPIDETYRNQLRAEQRTKLNLLIGDV